MAGPMIARLAGHYGCQILPEQGKQGFRLPCPAHRGDDANCHVFESDGGRIAAKCFSRGCEPSEILSAIERDTGMVRINPPGHSFQATYHRAGQPVDVWRIDEGGNKRYPTPGSRQAVPVELWGDEQAKTVIVCEGEKAARAIQRAGYTAASYMGGAGCAGLADHTKLRGRTAYIWPDNDSPGLRAGRDAAKAAHLSGAGVWMLSPVGKSESGDDAADVDDLPSGPKLPVSLNASHDAVAVPAASAATTPRTYSSYLPSPSPVPPSLPWPHLHFWAIYATLSPTTR